MVNVKLMVDCQIKDKEMYHHHNQLKNLHPSSRMSLPPERHLFLQGGNGPGDSGLVLSTDAKPRLKWTSDLHERFIEAVNQLGGAESKSTQHLKVQDSQSMSIQPPNFLSFYVLQKQLQNQF